MTDSSLWEDIAAIPLPGNKPRLMHQDNTVALVSKGSVDLFLVLLVNGKPSGQRSFVGHFDAGAVLFYLAEDLTDNEFGVLIAGSPETSLSYCSLEQFLLHATEADKLDALLNWTSTCFSTLIHKELSPHGQQIGEGEQHQVEAEGTVHTDEALCWISPGHYILLPGYLDLPLSPNFPFPLVRGLWLAATDGPQISSVPLDKLFNACDFDSLLSALNPMLMNILIHAQQLSLQNDKARQRQRNSNDQFQKNQALDLLARVYSERVQSRETLADDPNTQAMQATCELLNISITPVTHPKTNAQDHIQQLARGSNVPLRRVLLRGRWWLQEGEPMIAFLEGSNQAVALLPGKHRGFICFNPSTKQYTPVDEELVQQLEGNAFMPYRSLPSGQVSGRDLINFSLFGAKPDLLRVFFLGSLGGLLAMAIPLATGLIFDQVIPSSDRVQLLQITAAIAIVAMATGVFQYLQGLSLVRLESRAGHALQSAVWDRIAKLPVKFFANYTTGDLVQRAFGIDQIREQVSSTIVRTVLSFVFSIFSIGLLFYYSVNLALWACLLVSIAVAVTLLTGLLSVPATRRQQEIEGSLTSFVLQCIEGISKIRISYSQDRAFYRWAGSFAEQRSSIKITQNLQVIDKVFGTVFPLLCSMAIFYLLVHGSESITLSTGSFLAFNAAFINVLSNFLMISTSLVMIFRMVPVYQRMMPIMTCPVEADTATEDPGRLKGEIEISNLHFRYTADGPAVLNGIDMHIKPGEFVALVGTSGGGKSTLFRILLGFEASEQGSIAFDGKEISTLDKQELRRQMGVVLQSSSLIPGDIFTNIIGSANLSLDQAWEAARMAGFAEDIENMPMGMHTILSEGGGGLSGGQRQRLQIARAFVHKPKILFFDEATSALDNRTQEIVTKSMSELHATRIVIAHRLSTVIDADRILVLNKGVIAESGSYAELMAREGLFYDMAARQIN